MEKGRILISVTDKTGIEKFAKLVNLGWEIISTGGTAKTLRSAGIDVTNVEEVTNFPEMLGGRIKTLHPAIFGGILAIRDNPEHIAAIEQRGIQTIDIVVVNLYDFAGKPDIEQIDIGGPSLIRAAAKNGISTIPLIDPADYESIIDVVEDGKSVSEDVCEYLVMKVLDQTSTYDRDIHEWMTSQKLAGKRFLRPALAH